MSKHMRSQNYTQRLESLVRRADGFIASVKRGGHWVGPAWGDETNLWRDDVKNMGLTDE